MKGESAPMRDAPGTDAAKRQARQHLSPADRLEVQLSLFEGCDAVMDDAPSFEPEQGHPLAPAERHLRLLANATRRERHHWWLWTWEGRYQRAYLERIGRWSA